MGIFGRKPKLSGRGTPWEQVGQAIREGVEGDDLLGLVGEALKQDARIAPFLQPGYPLDVQAHFPPPANARAGYQGSMMWVRILGVAPDPDVWVGRLLNSSPLVGMESGQHVALKCGPKGLVCVGKV